MRDDEFDSYLEHEIEESAKESAQMFQIDLDRAKESSRTALTHRLADGLNTTGNYFYCAERATESKEGESSEEVKNEIIGHLWISIDEKEHFAWLDSIEVVEQFRGQGMGAQMLALLEEELSKRNIHSISLHVAANNERALRLYQKHGYKFTGHNMKRDW
jgi:ribosomal protein S18 acetylase RimI-like enzyme